MGFVNSSGGFDNQLTPVEKRLYRMIKELWELNNNTSMNGKRASLVFEELRSLEGLTETECDSFYDFWKHRKQYFTLSDFLSFHYKYLRSSTAEKSGGCPFNVCGGYGYVCIVTPEFPEGVDTDCRCQKPEMHLHWFGDDIKALNALDESIRKVSNGRSYLCASQWQREGLDYVKDKESYATVRESEAVPVYDEH